MNQWYSCKKDWEIESGVYYEKDKKYEGVLSNDEQSLKVFGKVGMVITFKKENDYFNF